MVEMIYQKMWCKFNLGTFPTHTQTTQLQLLTWKKPGGIGPPGMPSPGGMPPITGLGAAAAL